MLFEVSPKLLVMVSTWITVSVKVTSKRVDISQTLLLVRHLLNVHSEKREDLTRRFVRLQSMK